MSYSKNIALAGAGYWGKNLVRNFSQLWTLKTICDPNAEIRNRMSESYPDTTLTDDFDLILKDPNIKGVVIHNLFEHNLFLFYIAFEFFAKAFEIEKVARLESAP